MHDPQPTQISFISSLSIFVWAAGPGPTFDIDPMYLSHRWTGRDSRASPMITMMVILT